MHERLNGHDQRIGRPDAPDLLEVEIFPDIGDVCGGRDVVDTPVLPIHQVRPVTHQHLPDVLRPGSNELIVLELDRVPSIPNVELRDQPELGD
ncbi:hypothetical protein ACFYWY_25870 [Streptomyces sp. NPDC002870]|uniref:hypothetical protein n=1 Tax=Streptomyces sp. NPDC002870 TaxID=3364666 RepID=UPI00369A2180